MQPGYIPQNLLVNDIQMDWLVFYRGLARIIPTITGDEIGSDRDNMTSHSYRPE